MIYLDHAATSFPKPAAVLTAMQRWFVDVGVSGERGDGPHTRAARAEVQRAREQIAQLTGVPANRVAFCSGATEALNLTLRALCRPGARVLTTPFEHSSVVRPLRALQDERRIELEVTGCTAGGAPDEASLCTAMQQRRPDLLVLTHASNVTGSVFDVAPLFAEARRLGVATLLDASQTAGLLPIHCGADVVVASGHKALHGPPGIGFVAAHTEVELLPQKHGGTGSSAALDRHPTSWPSAFEAGTPNTPAIFGLAAALDAMASVPAQQPLLQALDALDAITAELAKLGEVRLLRGAVGARTPVLSLLHQRYDPLELAALLSAAGVHVRAGHHCAPWLHQVLGTDATGTLRISTSATTSAADVATLTQLLREL